MMDTLKRWCVVVGLWLARLGGVESITVPRTMLPLIPAARLMCAAVEAAVDPSTGGEYKRHQVYALMLKRYPEARKGHIALAIELALGGV
jgi:hypothetical protein